MTYSGPGVKTSPDFPIPDKMKAWVLGNPGELKAHRKADSGSQARRGPGAN